MARIVSPPVEQFDKLRQPLTDGELRVFKFFNELLDESWEIYLQPHLNGLRPDFVLLNPQVGIAVFEIKDWDLSALRYFSKTDQEGNVTLWAEKKGKVFSIEDKNPVKQAANYRAALYGIYCPRINKKNGFGLITCGVIFPNANEKDLLSLLGPVRDSAYNPQYNHYFPITGRESLTNKDLLAVFPETKRKNSRLMSEDHAKDLRTWLVEPDLAIAQRKPLTLDKRQLELATTRTDSGYRRIKGSAGSGKSLVLAAKAADLASQGKKVLVLTFNITLLHYLRDTAVRWPSLKQGDFSNIIWLNFHEWCKRICFDKGLSEDLKKMNSIATKSEIFATALPNMAENAIKKGLMNHEKYDAILVDEGQDFLPNWWQVLRKVVKSNGEMILVADSTQDIYETASHWTDEAMTGAGFRGVWSVLEGSYRLPSSLVPFAKDFAQRFLPSIDINLPETVQDSLSFDRCDLRWIQVSDEQAKDICVEEMIKLISSELVVSSADLTFLCDTKAIGYEVVKGLGNKGIKTVHTFDTDQKESRRQKIGFYMGDSRVKATTIHSFKGWESSRLVAYVGPNFNHKNLALLYTAMTRLKYLADGCSLTIVTSIDELSDYGKSWPVYDDLRTEIVL
ncbi:MAG: NERD domain-containing protein/DEAD/DEAH box helicase [Bermanella sp.]